jgi:hypothetical protein
LPPSSTTSSHKKQLFNTGAETDSRLRQPRGKPPFINSATAAGTPVMTKTVFAPSVLQSAFAIAAHFFAFFDAFKV